MVPQLRGRLRWSGARGFFCCFFGFFLSRRGGRSREVARSREPLGAAVPRVGCWGGGSGGAEHAQTPQVAAGSGVVGGVVGLRESRGSAASGEGRAQRCAAAASCPCGEPAAGVSKGLARRAARAANLGGAPSCPRPEGADGPGEGSSCWGTRLLGWAARAAAMGTQGQRGVTITGPALGRGPGALHRARPRGWGAGAAARRLFPFPCFSFRVCVFPHRSRPNASLWPGGKGPRSKRCPSADKNQATSVLGTRARPAAAPQGARSAFLLAVGRKTSVRVFLRSLPLPGTREGGGRGGEVLLFFFFHFLVSENLSPRVPVPLFAARPPPAAVSAPFPPHQLRGSVR